MTVWFSTGETLSDLVGEMLDARGRAWRWEEPPTSRSALAEVGDVSVSGVSLKPGVFSLTVGANPQGQEEREELFEDTAWALVTAFLARTQGDLVVVRHDEIQLRRVGGRCFVHPQASLARLTLEEANIPFAPYEFKPEDSWWGPSEDAALNALALETQGPSDT